MTETWYLLYGGSSGDGRGDGEYVGRTCNISVAARHYREISKNPYSTGYVTVITDEEFVPYSSLMEDYNPATLELKDAIQQLEDN